MHRRSLLALILAAAMSTFAAAQDLTPRNELSYFSPTAIEVLESMEAEQGRRFTETEVRALARSAEFQDRLLERFQQKRIQEGPFRLPKA